MRALAAVLFLSGCYSPSLHDDQFTCVRSDSCPSGYTCVCQECRKSGEGTTCDLGMSLGDLGAHDLATGARDLATAVDLRAVALGGCSSGARSTADPGHADVALCNAAWTVPGLNTSTPCSRVVGTNGKSGNTSCTSEDNCASGWHVCTSEADLTTSGFSKSDCLGVSAAGALWVTSQEGGPPPSPGPAECNSTTIGSVFGCGSFGKAPDAASCHLLQKVLLDPPGTGIDQCSVDTGGAFLCGTQMAAEATTVTKPARDTGGGVICCHG